MHLFAYRNGQFFCEQVPLRVLAEKAGTPLYVYSHGTILHHFGQVRRAFAPLHALICYAVKANANLAICRTLIRAGSGFDVVSGGELRKVLQAGADPRKVVYASVGKTAQEIEAGVRAGILFFNAESDQELAQIEQVCRRLGRRQAVSLRLNPEVDPHTHSFIATGHRASKFGMDVRTVLRLLRRRREFPHLDLAGLHIHIGSQILEARPFRAAIRRALGVAQEARAAGARIRTLNIGGGLGIIYDREEPQTPAAYARAVLPLLKRSGLKVILEPGRYIVGSAGILLTRVLYLKESHGKRFAIVDAGMNDLIRPSLYGAYHRIQPVERPHGSRRVGASGGASASASHAAEASGGASASASQRYDVVGPVCESGDFLGKGRTLPALDPGDLLAVMGAGAYGFVMASNYNARPRPAEVLVKGNSWHIVRRRESYRDLQRGEKVPAFLR